MTGRHDPCIVPRAVPVVEAAAALVLLDVLLDSPAVLGPAWPDQSIDKSHQEGIKDE